jgi:hypothetical protein
MNLYKFLLVFLGTLSLIIGLIGVVVPGLPTTPFLLLTAGLYVKGSDRMYRAFIKNKFFGQRIVQYASGQGMLLTDKLVSIASMWLMISLSCYFFISSSLLIVTVVLLGITGTLVLWLFVPTQKKEKEL